MNKWIIACVCSLFFVSGAALAHGPFAFSFPKPPSGFQSLSGGMAANGSRGIADDETGHPLADGIRQGISDGAAENIRYGGGVLATSIHDGVGNDLSNVEQDTVDSIRIGLDESGGSALSALLYEPGDQTVRKFIKYDLGYALASNVRKGSNQLAKLVKELGDGLANGVSGGPQFMAPPFSFPAAPPFALPVNPPGS